MILIDREGRIVAGNKTFEADYRNATKDPDVDVAIQAMMTLNTLKVSDAPATIDALMASNKARGVQELGRAIVTQRNAAAAGAGRGGPVLSPEQQDLMQRGQTIYTELCFSCHGTTYCAPKKSSILTIGRYCKPVCT